MTKIVTSALAAALLVAGVALAGEDNGDADGSIDKLDPEFIGDAKNCVSISRIDRTEILDSSNLLFYMQGGTIYLNALPHKCPGLRRYDAFSYRTSINQLCNVDTITVLRQGGPGLTPGATCGLGMFRPITEQTAQMLRSTDVTEAEPAKVSPDIESGEAESATEENAAPAAP